jgi:hypothetical protein
MLASADLDPLMGAALLKPDRYPNFEALTLSPGTGWLMLGAFTGLVLFIIAHREQWRRVLLRMEDPRTLGFFRIFLGLFTVFNVNGLYEHWTYLFTDEGMWTTDIAQQVRARGQFAGYGDGIGQYEREGFYDLAAFWEWAKGPNYSLLLFDSSPRFFYLHLAVFELVFFMLIIGFQTRWVKWVAWFAFHSITLRNTVYWEGTENIYRCWLFYLCLSRCDRAYSVDNWLRCRRLRKQKRLSEPGGPGGGAGLAPNDEHPKGLEPIYRMIPAWPRMLMMFQTAVMYCDTGVVKNGPVWHAGDAFYYALNLDHFYRLPPQQLSAWFGTNFFRLNAWIVHYWEACFPLVILGLVLRWHMREKVPPLKGWQRLVARGGLFAFAACFIGMMVHAYPVHYRKHPISMETARALIGFGTPVLVAMLVWLYGRLKHRPFKFSVAGRTFTIDLLWVCQWVLGRRVWLGLGLIFHVHLVLLMNIGWFTPGAMITYICFVNGSELANLLDNLGRGLARLRIPVPARIRRGDPPPPPEDPLLPHHHRDDRVLSFSAIFDTVAILLIGVVRMVQTGPTLWNALGKFLENKARIELPGGIADTEPQAHMGWFALCAAAYLITLTWRERRGWKFNTTFGPVVVLGVLVFSVLHEHSALHMRWSIPLVIGLVILGSRGKAEPAKRLPDVDPHSGRPIPPWAYGPLGRLLAGGLMAFQMTGIVVWLLPDKDSMNTWRHQAKEPFSRWLRNTHTSQGWQMFAPNPPRSNLFMRELVHDTDGEVYDNNVDVYACFQEGADEATCRATYPIPWIWYTRQRKMNRRIIGGEGGKGSWYQKWHARWVCREWEMKHGHLPEKVELIKVTYPIPKPEFVRDNGPYDPKTQYRQKNRQKVEYTEYCKTAPAGQTPNYIRERHGMETVDEKSIRVWRKNRCRNWEKRLRKEAEERGEEVDPEDPRFKVCLPRDPTVPPPSQKAAIGSRPVDPAG